MQALLVNGLHFFYNDVLYEAEMFVFHSYPEVNENFSLKNNKQTV